MKGSGSRVTGINGNAKHTLGAVGTIQLRHHILGEFESD